MPTRRRLQGTTTRNTRRRVDRSHEPGRQCQNCARTQTTQDTSDPEQEMSQEQRYYVKLVIERVPKEKVKPAYKFCNITRSDLDNMTGNVVHVCKQCVVCTTNSNASARNSPQNAWPAFIYLMLSDAELRRNHGSTLWRLVPHAWRSWWLPFARGLPKLHRISMSRPEPFVDEGTMESIRVKKALDLLHIKEVIWLLDTHCFYPSIKCPWGCSAFLPEATTSVPFDVIYTNFLDEDNNIKFAITNNLDTGWVTGIRPGFISSQHITMYNKEWKVMPTIVFKEQHGPVILCCGYHSKRTRGKYIHPPSLPFGPLSSMSADQIAAAVLQPRTIKRSKRKEYTNAFQLSKLQGGYNGVDTCTIVQNGRFDKTDFVNDAQDSLAISGRSDVRTHLVHESQHNHIICKDLVDSKLKMSQEVYPQELSTSPLSRCLVQATYISTADALELENVRSESGVDMSIRNENGIRKEIYFVPPWPSVLTYVHKAEDRHGSKFHPVKMPKQKETQDMRLLWVVKILVSHVSSIWKETCHCVENPHTWHGWVLQDVATHARMRSYSLSRNNPFAKRTTDLIISRKLHATADMIGYDPAQIGHVFKDMQNVRTVSYDNMETWDDIHQEAKANTVIIFKPFTPETNLTDEAESVTNLMPPNATNGDQNQWECRCVVMTELDTANNGKWKGIVYTRHGGCILQKWWKTVQTWTKTKRERCEDLRGHMQVDCVVMVRTKDSAMTLSKQKYMSLLGIQSKHLCPEHGLNLVTSKSHDKKMCVIHSCEGRTHITCPYSWCRIGICKNHEKMYEGAIPNIEQGDETYEADNHDDIHGDTSHDEGNNRGLQHGTSTQHEMTEPDDEPILIIAEHYIDSTLEDDLLDSVDISNLHSSVNDSLEDTTHVDDTNTNKDTNPEDFVTHGLVETDHLFDEEEQLCDTGILTTNTGRPRIQIAAPDTMIGLHVVFNKYRSLLIRYNQKLQASRTERNFIETIAAKNPNGLPLLYPEGLLFPSMFWKMMSDGTIIGAMPGAMLTDDASARRMGMATLYEQFRTRIMNTDILSSTSFRYHFFAFDACINLGIRGHDTRLILSRGFGEFHFKDGLRLMNDNVSTTCMSDSIDTKPVVNKLAAAMGEKMPTFFYTHTCSMKTHLGMRQMKKWLDCDSAVQNVLKAFGQNTSTANDETVTAARDMLAASACSICVRSWMLVSRIWMSYICNSRELPIGKIQKWWYRFELQELEANLPHIHSVLWHADDDGSHANTEKLLSMIRASINGLVTPAEYQQYLNEGIISSKQHLISILDNLAKFLEHKHNRRCMVPDRSGILNTYAGNQTKQDYLNCLRCKVPDNRTISTNPCRDTFMEMDVRHTPTADCILEEIGLKKTSPARACPIGSQYSNCLIARRHIPATSGCDGIISPVLAKLVIANPNSDNVQYTDSYGKALQKDP